MKNFFISIYFWIKKNPLEFGILIFILAVGAFCRLYKIDHYMTFLGDEGRDVIVVRRFLVEHHPPLIGPGTSVGNMYLGPIYYYMMAPALLLANFSPVGPAVEVALLGIATIFFVWLAAREWFGKIAAIATSLLYAISPAMIDFSKSSWNPNIMPFFALLCVYSIWKVWREEKFGWLITLGISYAFVLQSHYLGFLLAPTLMVFWILAFVNSRKHKIQKKFIKKSIFGVLAFVLLMSPLLIFDIRHGWINTKAAITFATGSRELSFSISNFTSKTSLLTYTVFSDLVSAKNFYLNYVVLTASLVFIIWAFIKRKIGGPLLIIFLWMAFGIAGLFLYKGAIYDHYLGFMFPAPFFLIGAIAQNSIKNKITLMIFAALFIYMAAINIIKSPVLTNPSSQMQRAITVAEVIKEKAGNKPYNLATISRLNNRDVYEYFLLLWGSPVVDTDPSALKYTVTDQLFVVCELPRDKCDPVHDPSAWITNFGWTKIVDEWDVWGGTLFKLGHTK